MTEEPPPAPRSPDFAAVSPVRKVELALANRLEKRVVRPLERGVGHGRPRAHMLHIGKTGGTAMKDMFASLPPDVGRYEIVVHRHSHRLPQIPRGQKVFFVVRDPVAKFVSGFNSRLREGRPRYHTPWTEAERTAFERFQTPDSLGRALSSTDAEERAWAYNAMISIRHVRDSYWDWFRSREYLETRAADLLLVQWCPDLSATFPQLRDLLGLPASVELPNDDVRSHRSPAGVDTQLSDLARENLERWYGRDYAFIDLCAEMDCFAGPSRVSVAITSPSADVPRCNDRRPADAGRWRPGPGPGAPGVSQAAPQLARADALDGAAGGPAGHASQGTGPSAAHREDRGHRAEGRADTAAPGGSLRT